MPQVPPQHALNICLIFHNHHKILVETMKWSLSGSLEQSTASGSVVCAWRTGVS